MESEERFISKLDEDPNTHLNAFSKIIAMAQAPGGMHNQMK